MVEIGFMIVIGAAIVQLIWALVWAIRALRHSRHLAPPQAIAMRLIAVHLAEPIINVFAVGALLFLVNKNFEQIVFGGAMFNGRASPDSELIRALLSSTWPMLILLLPILGVGSADWHARRINLRLVILGLVRWLITALILVYPLILPLGPLLLWYCIAWSRSQINHLATYSHQAIGFDGQGLLVDYSENLQPGAARINR